MNLQNNELEAGQVLAHGLALVQGLWQHDHPSAHLEIIGIKVGAVGLTVALSPSLGLIAFVHIEYHFRSHSKLFRKLLKRKRKTERMRPWSEKHGNTVLPLRAIVAIFLLSLAIRNSTTTAQQQAACDPGDAAALQEFKADFLENDVFGSWLPETDCCSFVQCNSQGRVEVIVIVADRIGVFPNPNNTGVVGESLGKLTALTSLTLIGVRFYGPIPTAWRSLTGLTLLYGALNNFTGKIPPEIGQLKNLNELKLYVGNLEGSLPATICQLTKLTRLEIESQLLSGPLPPCIIKLVNLQFFSLNDNHFAGPISSNLGGLPSLQSLILENNRFTGSIPPSLGKLSQLQTLRLTNNRLTGSIPADLSKAGALQEITLDNNQLTGTIPVALTKLQQLQTLSINSNRLSGSIPRYIGSFPSLTTVGLSSNRLTGTVPAEIGGLTVSNQTGTVLITIDHNSLSGTLPNTLSNVGSLIASYNRFTGGFPLSLCVNGYSVDLSHNLLDSGAPVGTVPANPKLQILDLSYNQIAGPIPSWLSSVTSLTTLDISNNKFNAGEISASLLGLPVLETLKAFNNLLNSPLPTLAFTSAIRYLDLHSLRLTGTIPADFFPKFPDLDYLDLSQNVLQGPLPSNIAQLTNLFHVDLSSNKLDGQVPDLSALTQLVYLNLTGNMFQEPVPSVPALPIESERV
ncbi:hypothetical protein R1flu_018852 [Riccia fluitans]|uniref:Leucine-rich repeat-containing N-terminal plant-type domain-containing protein n=1 Tax=Riccia fluitans TaxID=41844 RepID=A0ABD1ZKH1_9MARC